MPELIDVTAEDGVATITLNRPDQLNTYSVALKDELIGALDYVDEDDDVRVAIITGSGRAFCAGMDLTNSLAFSRLDEPDEARRRDSGGELTLRIFALDKPIIAAVNGAAMGVGVTMTLPMDIRLASADARFGFVFARRGIVMESASSWFLPRLVGPQQAAEWAYTGRVFGAQEALRAGLVHGVYPAGDLRAAAGALAREITGNTAAVSVSLNRQLIWRGLTYSHPMQSHIAESRAMFDRGASADVAEGMASFAERRDPRYIATVPADLPDVFGDWVSPPFTR